MKDDFVFATQEIERWPPDWYFKASKEQEKARRVPKKLLDLYAYHRDQMTGLALELRQYFDPITDPPTYISKYHERYNHVTGKYEHDGEYLRLYGPDEEYKRRFEELNKKK